MSEFPFKVHALETTHRQDAGGPRRFIHRLFLLKTPREDTIEKLPQSF
jgi:hypothetical protein